MNRDYVIIVGAMKSGTSTLFDVLARHPQIAPASNKEPGFFAFEDIWQKGFDWFDTLFDFDPETHRYRLEASTDYTKEPFATGVWERMTANPDVRVKLLYIMRHPIKRMESHARHVQSARKELGQHISPRPDHSLDAGPSPVNLVSSQYATQLDAFAEARAAGNLHCLTLEELGNAPEATLAAIYDFLELEPGSQELRVRNAASARTQVNPTWKRLNSLPMVSTLNRLLPSGLRQSLRDRFRKSKVTVEGRFTMTESETAAMVQILRPDLKRLQDHYGINVAQHWDISPD